MIYKTVDLYESFGMERQGAAGGSLYCWVPQTPTSVSLTRRKPAVLIFPGGGYHHTSLREAEPVALRFVAAGFAAFVLHYSCSPSRFPVALQEAALAMLHIRQQSAEYEIDPKKVAALGFSAGGHLCGCLGTMYDSLELSDLGEPEQLRPDALCLCYPVAVSWGKTHLGSFDNLCEADDLLRSRLSLDKLVRGDMPPVFLWHTRNDESVPCRNSLVLAQAMENAGVDFTLHIFRKGRHGLATADCLSYPIDNIPPMSGDVAQWMAACVGFLKEVGLHITD